MRYLLDANTVIGFLSTGHDKELAQLGKRMQLAVVAEVRREADARGSRSARWWDASGIQLRAIDIASPAYQTLLDLGTPNLRGLGERASIALALHDASLTFVTSDKNAMYLAHRELHGTERRVASLATFLRDARGAGLPWEAVDDVYREAKLPQPTWWASWRAGP